MLDEPQAFIPGVQIESLLHRIATWGNTTTIIVHGGCVFEFKGAFPAGTSGESYFNLQSGGVGFEGHLNLARIDKVTFQSKPHRGRDSLALVFRDDKDSVIFKVFVGRSQNGDLIEQQVTEFNGLMNQANKEITHD